MSVRERAKLDERSAKAGQLRRVRRGVRERVELARARCAIQPVGDARVDRQELHRRGRDGRGVVVERDERGVGGREARRRRHDAEGDGPGRRGAARAVVRRSRVASG